jgi:TRAP-type transport system small permease protein
VQRQSMANLIERAIQRLSKIFAYAACAALAMMMLLTVADVILRYFFFRPILGAYEVTEIMMMFLVFCTLAYNQSTKTNIRVLVLFNRLSQRTQRVLDFMTNLLGIALFILVSWQAVVFGIRNAREGLVSIELGLPKYPFVFLAALGVAAFCLVLAVDIVKSIARGGKK